MRLFAALFVILTQALLAQQSPHGKIKNACEDCHSTESWKMREDAKFDHASTGFELMGRHKFVQCRSCHDQLEFTKARPGCLTCHTDVHRSELGTNCSRCHSMESWIVADMKQRHQQTRFPLFGRHTLADCEACHERASSHRYAGTPLTCISCHRSDYLAAANPNHVSAGFSVDCNRCHKVVAADWGGGFDHGLTRFPLTGAHRALSCSQCHVNNQFTQLPTDCYSCHAAAYASAQSPDHVNGKFSHICQLCHTTAAWQPSIFDHNSTGFQLTGAHRTTACQDCHVAGNYQLSFTGCVQCHLVNYQQSQNPNHVAGNFPQTCQDCHSATAWSPASFNHALTKFPLTGGHLAVSCVGCHVAGNYQIVYSGCYPCHQSDFTGTTNPNHVQANFSHSCENCHTTASWTTATFDHSTTKFPLTGKHAITGCQLCHVGGNYQLVYVDCYQCHQADYQRPTDPNHVTANFGHHCELCHTTTAWSPSTFDHDNQYFRIYSGHHQGTWTTCTTCHPNNANFAQFTCLSCHEHNQSDTDSQHQGISGYSYTSPACYNCHRNAK